MEEEYPYVIFDARYERVRGGGVIAKPGNAGGDGDQLAGPAASHGGGIGEAREPDQLEGFPFRPKGAGPAWGAPGGERPT